MNSEYGKVLNYLEAGNQAITEEMERDRNVVFLSEDVMFFRSTGMFDRIEKTRVRNTPISENSFSGIAVGAAMTGLRPIVNINIANFSFLAADQIINQASKLHYMTGGQMKVPAVFLVLMIHNTASAAQHSDRPYPMFMNAPGLKIITPATSSDMKGLMKSAIRDDDPVLIFVDSNLAQKKEVVPLGADYLIPIGTADIKRPGHDVTIVSISGCLFDVLSAADRLAHQGISAEVIDPRTLVPMDVDTIVRSVEKTGRLVVVDSSYRINSVASEIAAVVSEEAFEYLRNPIQRVTTPYVNIPFSPALEKSLYPSEEKIFEAVKRII